ncbi:MAG: hypothetical protein U9N42_05910 [Campylobacterota bacterium]|nr:hypothetical protein [Campylobacterota bacterium]
MKNKEAIQNQLVALNTEAYNGYLKHKSDFKLLEYGYLSIIDEAKRTSLKNRRKSTLNPQLIKPKIDKIERDVMEAFFGNDELADIQAENLKDENDLLTQDALIKELKEYGREENLYSKVKPIIRNALVYGTSITKVYWSHEANKAKIEQCKLNEVFLDPYAPTSYDVRYMVHRITSMTIGDLKKKFKKIDWNKYSNSKNSQEALEFGDAELGDYQRVEIFEIYRRKNGSWYLSTMLSDETFLRTDVKLKYGHPFIISTVNPQFVGIDETPVRAYGSSFIAPLLPLQTENVIRRNQQIDAIDLQLNQRFLTTANSGLVESDLISNKKSIVVQNLNEVKELQAPRIDTAIYDTDKLEAEAQEMSGITKYSQGLNDKKNLNQTATGMSILANEGGSVISDINRAFNENFFRPLVRRILLLTYEFKKSSNFAQVDRSKPMRQKVVINVGTGSNNKEIKINNLNDAITQTTQSVQLFMQLQDERAKKYLNMLDELQQEKLKLLGFNSIIESIEQQEQQEQEAQEEMMMQQQQLQQEVIA